MPRTRWSVSSTPGWQPSTGPGSARRPSPGPTGCPPTSGSTRGWRVGEGRDRERRRQPQGPAPGVDPPPPEGGRAGRSRRARARPRHRIVRERGARCRHPRGGRSTGRSRSSCRRGPSPRSSRRCTGLRATVTVCPRRDDDAPGDPCVHRFREAVERGAVPFGVQGPENALALDGGRTLGWELAPRPATDLDRVFVQVGGGALAACVGRAFADAGAHPRLHAVQAAGCAPMERAWRRAQELGVAHAAATLGRVHVAVGGRAVLGGRRHPRRRDL